MAEERWAALLAERQDKGLFWCDEGAHYVEVYRNRIREALHKVIGR